MASGSTLVDSLVEFYEVAEIRAFWKQVFDARASRSREPVQITNSSFEGGSASGIVLTTPAEMDEFIRACQAAIAIKTGSTTGTPASQLGSGADFSQRILSV